LIINRGIEKSDILIFTVHILNDTNLHGKF